MKYILSLCTVLIYTILIGQASYSKTYSMEPHYLQGSALAYNSDKIVVSVKTGCFDSVLYNCSYLYSFDYDGNYKKDVFVEDLGLGISQNLVEVDNSFLLSGHDRTKDSILIKSYDSELIELSKVQYAKYNMHDGIVNRSLKITNEKILLTNHARYEASQIVADPLYIIDRSTMEVDTTIDFQFSQNYDTIIDIQEDIDGSYVFLLRSLNTENPWEELFIIRLDPADDYSQEVIPLTSTFHDSNIKNFLILPNGNYVYTQFLNLRTNVVYCVDRQGNPLWNFEIEGDGFEREVIQEMTLLENGDVLACGFYTGRFPEDPLVTEYDYEVNCGWLMRLSPEGDLVWRHYYPEFYKDEPWPTSRYSYLYDVEEMPDGTIIATGMMSDYDEDGNRYKDDLWLLKVTADGCLESNDCDTEMQEIKVVSSIEDETLEIGGGFVYPNPATDWIYLSERLLGYEKINVFDTFGNSIIETVVSSQIDITSLNNGVYFMKFSAKNKDAVLVKFIVTK